jgi:hypothetical protein
VNFTQYSTEIKDAPASEPIHCEPLPPPQRGDAHQGRGRSFDKLWGLHPGVALLALVVNTMLFGGELVTAGAIFPLALVVGIVLGLVTYRAQVRWHGDDDENALIKAVIMTVLTVIPTPLPDFLYLSFGTVGLVHSLRRES